MPASTHQRTEALHTPDQLQPLLRLAGRIARLNPDSPTIGAGMLASLVDDARQALGKQAGKSADVCTGSQDASAAPVGTFPALDGPSADAACQAVHYLLRRIQRDPRLAYYFVDTESLERLITAHAMAFGMQAQQFRQTYLADLQVEAPECRRHGEEA